LFGYAVLYRAQLCCVKSSSR